VSSCFAPSTFSLSHTFSQISMLEEQKWGQMHEAMLQVNAYAANNGIRYGMISSGLWSWVFCNDGCNNMTLSQAFRYDATNPTVLEVCCCQCPCTDIRSHMFLHVDMQCGVLIHVKVVYQSFVHFHSMLAWAPNIFRSSSSVMQVHAFVTYISLQLTRLSPWSVNPQHPNLDFTTRQSKRSRSQAGDSCQDQGSADVVSDSPPPASQRNKSQVNLTTRLAICANATSVVTGMKLGPRSNPSYFSQKPPFSHGGSHAIQASICAACACYRRFWARVPCSVHR